MYNLYISKTLEAKLNKLKFVDKVILISISKKVCEIQKDPYHFKPLGYPLKGIRRVHIKKSFVLTYEIIESEKAVRLLDFDHHDKIYSYYELAGFSSGSRALQYRANISSASGW